MLHATQLYSVSTTILVLLLNIHVKYGRYRVKRVLTPADTAMLAWLDRDSMGQVCLYCRLAFADLFTHGIVVSRVETTLSLLV